MDCLDGYESSDNDGEDPTTSLRIKARAPDRRYLLAAPITSITTCIIPKNTTLTTLTSTTLSTAPLYENSILTNNPRKSSLPGPLHGPSRTDDPSISKPQSRGVLGVTTADVAFDKSTFDDQRTAFQRGDEGVRGPDEKGGVVVRSGLENWTYDRGGRGRNGGGGGNNNGGEGKVATTEVGDDDNNDDDNDDDDSKENMNNDSITTTSIIKKRKRCRGRRGRTTTTNKSDDPLVHGSDDEILHGAWAPPSRDLLTREEDQLTTLQKVGGIESNLPTEIRTEREHIAERNRLKRSGKDDNGDGAGENTVEDRDKRDFDRMVERKVAHLLPPRMEGEDEKAMEGTTIWHGGVDEEFDYKGRSWTCVPSGWSPAPPYEDRSGKDVNASLRNYVPKKCVHRSANAHGKGVHRIRLSPNTGHLLLSGGLDGKCKIWSVRSKGSNGLATSSSANAPTVLRCLRTYHGHTAAVRDVRFNSDGSTFLSASFDRFVRLWNTEDGRILGTYSNRRVPYVVRFHPHDDNSFVVGCSDNKIVAYDATTGKITQEYDHHLAPVNAIEFVNVENSTTKMVTTSDDKKMLIWEWDVGVPIKYIGDPTMHSMPCLTVHPSGSYLAGQGLDNKISVYGGLHDGRFVPQRKKKFMGHTVAGYACEIHISPDGRFLCSGDGNGKLTFWEWTGGKLLQKYRAHDKGPAIGCVWHPTLPSTVFSCGWDGAIKVWE